YPWHLRPGQPTRPTLGVHRRGRAPRPALHRCLNDDTIDIDLRAGGALILLYGLGTTRVLGLRQNQIHTKDGNTYLTLGDHDMVLPPKLAQLLAQLPRPTRRSTLPEPLSPDRLLFPGRTPDRPVNSGVFGKRL